MIARLIALALCWQCVTGTPDVSLTIDGPSDVRGKIRYTPNSDEFESTFAVTPGSRGLEPPFRSGNIEQNQQRPQQQHQPQQQPQQQQQLKPTQRQVLKQRVLTDSYQNPLPNQRQYQSHSRPAATSNVPVPSRYYLAPLRNRQTTSQISNTNKRKPARLVQRKQQSRRQRLRSRYQDCEPEEEVQEEQVPVVTTQRPAIEQNFYDVEHKVIVRPVGTAVIELDQNNQDDQPTYDPGETDPASQDGIVYNEEVPTVVYQQEEPTYYNQQPYAPVHPNYGYGQYPYGQYPPVYVNRYPSHGYYPGPPVYGPPAYYPEQPPVIISDEGYDHGEEPVEEQEPPVVTTPLPCPPIDSEVIEPESPAEHPETVPVNANDNPENENAHQGAEVFDYNSRNETDKTPSDFVDIVYASQQPSKKSDKLQYSPTKISVHFSPDQVNADQTHNEALVRGDDSKNSASLQAEQPDQFHHNDESNVKRINVVVSNRGQARTNEQRLIDLYSVKGGVSEVTNSASQSLQLGPSNIHQRARVISVTPAPDHEAQYEASERSQIRRVVVSKPIQRGGISSAYSQRQAPRKTNAARSKAGQEYVTPVPQNIAHLRAGHLPENY